MPFTRVPKASSAIFRAVSFPDELSGIEESSAHNRKTTIEKKRRIVQLGETIRKAMLLAAKLRTRNTIRCFGELDFASHIVSTCDRAAEGTAEEWSTIRNASMEHAKLEVAAHSNRSVWKLGDEIRGRIISGMNGNHSGAVALVDAAEMYDRAAETFEKKWNVHGNNVSGIDRLGFKKMRAAELYHDFELRGVEKFRGLANLDDVLQTATNWCRRSILSNALLPIGTSKRFGVRRLLKYVPGTLYITQVVIVRICPT
jgi:hypothetical protein